LLVRGRAETVTAWSSMVRELHYARHMSATTGADAGVPEHVMQRRLGRTRAGSGRSKRCGRSAW
jgi:hypothetical protein